MEQAAQWGWAISTLKDIQNSDAQVSEKAALNLMLILLEARGRTRGLRKGPFQPKFLCNSEGILQWEVPKPTSQSWKIEKIPT